LADVARYLHSNTARSILVQAVCAAPMFPVRWRWSAAIALALPRFRGGKKVPAPLARMAAEDLLAAVFPDQLACAENLPGELEIPDHPLVRQTLRDCLEEAMDAGGFERLLRALESGGIQVLARDLTEPSPLALEVLSARPYAYLDDAPLEERRTQAVMSRRWLDPQSAADLGKLDAEAIRSAAGGGRVDARRVHGHAAPGGRVVRKAAARAYPRLHRQAAARRDRAHRGARLRALPPRLAARHARASHGGSRCGGRGARAARGLRGAGERLGDGDPARAHRRVRARLAR